MEDTKSDRSWLVRGVVLLAAVIAVAWVLVWLTRTPDPVHNGKRLSEWIERVQSIGDDFETAQQSIIELGPRAHPLLLSMLGAEDSKVKVLADEWLPFKVVRESASNKRQRAWKAMQLLPPEALPPVSELRPFLVSRDLDVRVFATYAMGRKGHEAAGVVPELFTLLNHEAPPVRGAAAVALGQIGEQPERVIPALISLLQDEADMDGTPGKNKVKLWAAWGLGHLGEKAEPAIPAILEEFKDMPTLSLQVALVIQDIAPDRMSEMLPRLLDQIRHSDSGTRRVGTAALRVLGDQARPAVPLLLDNFGSYPKDRSGVVKALSAIDQPRADALLPTLVEMLASSEQEQHEQALLSLPYIRTNLRVALPALRGLTNSSSWFVRDYTAEWIERIEASEDGRPQVK
jgi:HEAT repeat protein